MFTIDVNMRTVTAFVFFSYFSLSDAHYFIFTKRTRDRENEIKSFLISEKKKYIKRSLNKYQP